MADTDYNDSGSEADIDGGKKQRRSAAGRKLMRWNPDVDQYVLLAVEQACSEKGQPVPWNYVAEKLNGYVTGEGIKQHLAKVRKYREENGRPVPSKSSSKGGNRKAAAYGTGAPDTPQRTPKKKKNGDDEAPLTGKGAGLLWSNPKSKPPKPQKEPNTPKEIKEPKSQKPKEAKKKAQGEDAAPVTPKTSAKKSRKSNVKDDAKAVEDEKVAGKKKSTGKRGRAKKESSVKDEDADADGEEYFENDSPTKKQRLRATYHVNYNENEIAGYADDEYEEENIYEARSDRSNDGVYDDGVYGSQPHKGLKSEGASSRSSGKGMTTPVQPPPNFDNMLHSRTGMHAYGAGYMDDGQGSNFGAPFTGLNNSYGPSGYGDRQDMGMGADDMMGGYGRGFNGSPYVTADQLQMMHAQNTEYGGYGANQHAHGHQGGEGVPARKAKKQETRRDDDAKDGVTTPLSKKDKKKHQDTTKQKSDRKIRKDSVHGSDNSGDQQQQAAFFNDDNFGNIPIANDTGHGFGHGHGHGHGFGTGMPNFSMPLTTYDPQQGETLTASPTDITGDYKFPSATANFQNGSTGITPHFNNFNFGDDHGIGADFAMPSVEFGGGYGNDQYSGMATLNSSFSNSTDASTAGSQSDQTMPGMQFGADTGVGAGLGLGDDWMPGMGMGMDMSGDGGEENDVFSMLNQDGYH